MISDSDTGEPESRLAEALAGLGSSTTEPHLFPCADDLRSFIEALVGSTVYVLENFWGEPLGLPAWHRAPPAVAFYPSLAAAREVREREYQSSTIRAVLGEELLAEAMAQGFTLVPNFCYRQEFGEELVIHPEVLVVEAGFSLN